MIALALAVIYFTGFFFVAGIVVDDLGGMVNTPWKFGLAVIIGWPIFVLYGIGIWTFGE